MCACVGAEPVYTETRAVVKGVESERTKDRDGEKRQKGMACMRLKLFYPTFLNGTIDFSNGPTIFFPLLFSPLSISLALVSIGRGIRSFSWLGLAFSLYFLRISRISRLIYLA